MIIYEVSKMKYSQATQRAITYIEEHLYEEIQLVKLPMVVGYSKFHLSRIFKLETGLTIGDYIRLSRLATAAYNNQLKVGY